MYFKKNIIGNLSKMNLYLILIFGIYSTEIFSAELTDRQATPLTLKLYNSLFALTNNKQTLFGQQDATAYGVDWKDKKDCSDMKEVCGYLPALYGWEVGGIEKKDSENLDGVSFKSLRNLIINAYNQGGVNTISWHLTNPVTGKSAWDKEKQDVIIKILPGGDYNSIFNSYLDNLAVFFESLKLNGISIPIIFRPFHENTGISFWWGINRCTSEEYIALWKYTVTYLRDKKHIHNLIYAYSPDKFGEPEKYLKTYPGDKFVDILGLDYYHKGGDSTANAYIAGVSKRLDFITTEAKKRSKIAAFTETGLETITMNNWWTDVLLKAIGDKNIAYVMVWRNANNRKNHFFGPTPNHPSNSNFIEFINKDKIITSRNKISVY